MNRRKLVWTVGIAGVIAATFGGSEIVARVRPAAAGSLPIVEQADRSGPVDGELDALIARVRARAAADPFSAGDQAMLAQLFLQRARETGSYPDVVQAEGAARRSLALRGTHNANTWGFLSMALIEQHRFAEAREAALKLVESEPGGVAYRAHLGEIDLELGDYASANRIFTSLEPSRNDPDVAPRMAHWLEVMGHPEEARTLLYAARERSLAEHGQVGEHAAWYHLRVGDLELRHGRLAEADEALKAGLAANPGDYRVLSAMARLDAARGQWARSIAYGEAVIGRLLDPSALILLSEVALASGDSARADEYATVLQVAIEGQQTAYHRDWGLFLLDRDAQVDQVVERARAELEARRDIYGYDLLAWGYHKQGRGPEARAAMRLALQTGARDALLYYHAGMIEHSGGREGAAQRYLAEALRINPTFHPEHAPIARRTLDSIRGPWYRRIMTAAHIARRGDV